MQSATREGPNKLAVSLLFAANVILTVSAFNMASVYIFVSSEFNQTVYGLGILTSSFFLGYALFEVPGGFLSAKSGPRELVILGCFLNSLGVIGSAASPSFDYLALFRFITGLGYALAFPSILVLTVRYFRKGSEGLGVGITAFSYSIGAAAGLFGWSLLGAVMGWRLGILLNGAMSLAIALIMFLLPRENIDPAFRVKLSHLRKVMSSRSLGVLSLSLFGLGAASSLISNFLLFYMEEQLQLSIGFAGLIAALGSILPMFGGLVGGRLYDMFKIQRRLVVGFAIGVSFGVSVVSIGTLPVVITSSIVVGVAGGGAFTVALSEARRLVSASPEFEAVVIGWVDSFSMVGGFVSPIYFSLMVVDYGYPLAWLIGGLAAVLLTLPILATKLNPVELRERSHL